MSWGKTSTKKGVPKHGTPKPMKCLRCDKLFETLPHKRLCPRCTATLEENNIWGNPFMTMEYGTSKKGFDH